MDENKKYKIHRSIVAIFFIFEIAIIIKIILCNFGFDFASYNTLSKYIFAILFDLLGLFVRNWKWLFGYYSENKQGKNLLSIYLVDYQIFVLLSSILVSSTLMLNSKIETSSYLFFTFSMPLNVYIGFTAYQAFDFLKGLISKNI